MRKLKFIQTNNIGECTEKYEAYCKKLVRSCWVSAQSPTSVINEKAYKYINMDNIQLV